ncbi:hypothetical protein AB0M02_06960 [Actinoplanes sp. NPDC051861]|uniref:hypothetical protein n=1 Tax=Actinoplanes sp. NPDC051861 TaxID=3155170 RepID=UPI0034209709
MLLHLEGGEEGFVDSSDVSDRPVRPDEWPMVGARVTAVVLGSTRLGRWRLSLRAGDVGVVTALEDPEAGFGYWNALKASGAGDAAARDAFFSFEGADPLLGWALTRPPHSPDRRFAEELLARAPGVIKDRYAPPDAEQL